MSYVGIGTSDPNHPLEVEGQVFISNVEQGSTTNLVPFEVHSDYTGITGNILEGARQMRLRVTPSGTTSSNVNIDMGIEPTSGSYFYISNPVVDTALGSNTALRIVQAGHVEVGSNLSVSGNVVASNIIGGSPLTLSSDTLVKVAGSGGLSVTGPLNVDGGGTINGTSATYTGQVQAATVSSTGVINGASATVTGQVQGATVSSTGVINGASATVTGQVRGATVSSTGVINGASATVTGQVKGATVSSTGVMGATSMYLTNDLIHTGDTDTRLQFDTNQISLRAGGTDTCSVTNSGVRVTGTVSSSGDIYCPTLTVSDYMVHSGDTNTYMGFSGNDTIVFFNNGAERMRIESGGDIGINKTNPAKKLDVNGDARVGTFSVTSTQVMTDNGVKTADLQWVNGATFSDYMSSVTFGAFTTWYRNWDFNGSNKMYLVSSGNLYIDGTYQTFSDYRIKENIQSIDDDYAMGVIRGLDPKSFNWKDKEKDKGTEYGFLAQEVKALYPEMVSVDSGIIPMDQRAYPSQITSDTTMEITVSDGSTWTSGDKIVVKDATKYSRTLTVNDIQNSVLSLSAETISSDMVDSNSETYIYGKEVDDFHRMKVSYLDPLMISALQQLDRRVAALENR